MLNSTIISEKVCLDETKIVFLHIKSGKNCKNFKGMIENKPLRQIIEEAPPGSVIFRTDYPQYNAEFVGNVLAKLVEENLILKLGQGIYYRPKMSRFGADKPSIIQIAESIAKRDNTKILPVGETVLNELGLSTQVPMNYSFIAVSSGRTIKLGNQTIVFKRGVPRNFAYQTTLMAYLVQALKALGKDNVGETELTQIRKLIRKEPEQDKLRQDLMLVPIWMRKILSPIIKKNGNETDTLDKQ